jgi:Superfamily I DNA and RNA helicases
VSYHWDINAIDMTEGNWMVLCRTNNIANNIGNQLKNNGYLFYRQGSGFSASAKVIESIKIWTRLSRGEFITQADLKRMWQLIDMDKKQRRVGNKLVKTWEPEQMVSIDVLTDIMPEDNWKEPWFKALKINEGEQLYLRSVLRSGDKFDEKNPRIRLSTIHKVKGGECDNVIVLLDSSRGCQTFGQEDAEIRTFYVGLTRAKENLHIIESNDRWAFKL